MEDTCGRALPRISSVVAVVAESDKSQQLPASAASARLQCLNVVAGCEGIVMDYDDRDARELEYLLSRIAPFIGIAAVALLVFAAVAMVAAV
jgi:hypothetical protein